MASKARKNLSDAEKDMISRVHCFFEQELDFDRRLSIRNPRRRTHLATGVSETTVTRCVRRSWGGGGYYLVGGENLIYSEGKAQNESPTKTGRPKVELDDFTKCSVMQVFHGVELKVHRPLSLWSQLCFIMYGVWFYVLFMVGLALRTLYSLAVPLHA